MIPALLLAVTLAIPNNFLLYEQAAATMLKGMTVCYLLRRTFNVQRGNTVLIHAAAGGLCS